MLLPPPPSPASPAGLPAPLPGTCFGAPQEPSWVPCHAQWTEDLTWGRSRLPLAASCTGPWPTRLHLNGTPEPPHSPPSACTPPLTPRARAGDSGWAYGSWAGILLEVHQYRSSEQGHSWEEAGSRRVEGVPRCWQSPRSGRLPQKPFLLGMRLEGAQPLEARVRWPRRKPGLLKQAGGQEAGAVARRRLAAPQHRAPGPDPRGRDPGSLQREHSSGRPAGPQ